MKIRRIAKRDGREVPFDKQKIAAAVARAQSAAGENDAQAATDVADIVEMELSRRYVVEMELSRRYIAEMELSRRSVGERTHLPPGAASLPGIEEIQDLVERALVELGHAAVAKAYILYRDRRARIRAALETQGDARPDRGGAADARALADASDSAPAMDPQRAAPPEQTGQPAPTQRAQRGPRVQVSGGLAAWRKSRIVAALMDEADLPRPSAEEVASRVEERVFSLGVKRLSTALIRELVDNELVELGLSQALRRQRPVGLPRHDLRRIVGVQRGESTPKDTVRSGDVNDRIAGEILRRFALEDVLSENAAEQHLSGEIFVEDLERPHQALTSSIPCELLLRGEPSARSAFEMLDELGDAARATSHGVVLEDALALVTGLSRSARGGGLGGFLAALSGLARASSRRIDLAFTPTQPRSVGLGSPRNESRGGQGTGAGGGPMVAPGLVRLLEEIAALEDDGRVRSLPRVFLDARDILRLSDGVTPALARSISTLLTRGQLVATWSSARMRCVGPTLRRNTRERGVLHCGGSVAINVPRAARRAGPWREDALLENLARQVESALDAIVCLREFQRGDGARAFEMRGRVSYALTPVGLREALRWLGDGEVRPEQGGRVVAFLVEATQRFATARGVSVALSPYFGERAAVRFAELDLALFQVAQPLLFEAAPPSSSAARGAPYSTGFELAPVDPGLASSAAVLAPVEAALVQAFECGALHPPAILRALSSGIAASGHPALDALEVLDRARSKQRGGLPTFHALPPAPSLPSVPEFEVSDVSDAIPFDSEDDPADRARASSSASLYPDADPQGFGVQTSLRRVRSDDPRSCD